MISDKDAARLDRLARDNRITRDEMVIRLIDMHNNGKLLGGECEKEMPPSLILKAYYELSASKRAIILEAIDQVNIEPSAQEQMIERMKTI